MHCIYLNKSKARKMMISTALLSRRERGCFVNNVILSIDSAPKGLENMKYDGFEKRPVHVEIK